MLQALTGALTSALTRAAIMGAVAVMALLIGIGGVASLFIALYFALSEHFTRAEAALMTAIAAFLVCGLIFLILRARSGGHSASAAAAEALPATDGESMESVLASAMDLGGGLRRLIERNRRDAAIGAFVIGVICGVSPAARRGIRDLARAIVRGEKREPPQPPPSSSQPPPSPP